MKIKLFFFFTIMALVAMYNINFTPEDYKIRVDKIKADIVSNNLDAFITVDEHDIYYLTGISLIQLTIPFFMIIFPDKDPAFLVKALEGSHIADESAIPVSGVYKFWSTEKREYYFEDNLKVLLDGMEKIGINPTMHYDTVNRMLNLCPMDGQTRRSDCNSLKITIENFVIKARMVKDEKELALIRRSAGFTNTMIQHIFDTVYTGATVFGVYAGTASVSQQVQIQEIITGNYDLLKHFVRAGAFNSPYTASPHEIPGLFTTFGNRGPNMAVAQFRTAGYCAETERMFFLQPPNQFEYTMYNHVMMARNLSLAQIKPGNTIGDMVNAGDYYLIDQGLGEYMLHSVGHGMGEEFYEEPYGNMGSSEIVFEKGMVMAIEPALYVPGIGGFRLSDTVVVTEDGYEIYGDLPTDIESLTLNK